MYVHTTKYVYVPGTTRTVSSRVGGSASPASPPARSEAARRVVGLASRSVQAQPTYTIWHRPVRGTQLHIYVLHVYVLMNCTYTIWHRPVRGTQLHIYVLHVYVLMYCTYTIWHRPVRGTQLHIYVLHAYVLMYCTYSRYMHIYTCM